MYADHIHIIVTSASVVAELHKATKKCIQETTDVKMQDAMVPSGLSIQSAVNRAVNMAVKQITLKDGGVSCMFCTGTNTLTDSAVIYPPGSSTKGQGQNCSHKAVHTTAHITTGG